MIPDETTVTDKLQKPQSTLANVSVRAWCALLLVVTYCGLQFSGRPVDSQFSNIVILVLGAFIGTNLRPGHK